MKHIIIVNRNVNLCSCTLSFPKVVELQIWGEVAVLSPILSNIFSEFYHGKSYENWPTFAEVIVNIKWSTFLRHVSTLSYILSHKSYYTVRHNYRTPERQMAKLCYKWTNFHIFFTVRFRKDLRRKMELQSTTSPQICCCTTLWKANSQKNV